MPAPEHEATAGDPHAPTSRRTFLGLAAAAGGVGLTATPVGADGGADSTVTVVASRAHVDAVRSAADQLRERRSETSVTLDVTETTRGLELFTTGEVDVVAGDRPLLPAERARASEHGVDQEFEELPTDAATLTRSSSTWVDPLRPNRIAETWSDGGSVATWAEIPASEADSADPTPMADSSTTDVADHDSVLVRGVRDTQYATGQGGVGYYEPEPDWLTSDGAPGAENAAETPVVRLAYLGVDRASLRTPVVEDLVTAFETVSTDRVGDAPVFEDPYGVTAT